MSTLKVDNIEGRGGTTVTISNSNDLSVAGNLSVTGTITGSTTGALTGNVNASSGNNVLYGRTDIRGIREVLSDITASGTQTVNYATTGNALFFDNTGTTGAFTINITNLPTDNGFVFSFVVLVSHGAGGGGLPTTLQIGGSAQTVNWAGGSAPTGTASKIESFSYQIIRRSNAWTVLGSSVTTFG